MSLPTHKLRREKINMYIYKEKRNKNDGYISEKENCGITNIQSMKLYIHECQNNERNP